MKRKYNHGDTESTEECNQKEFTMKLNIKLKYAAVFMICAALSASSCKKNTESKISSVETSEDVGGYYTCSMHPQVIQKEPGNCPICGMKLVFVEGKTIKHEHKSGDESKEAELYVCPMHPQVTSDKPGKCPICGMDLVKIDKKEKSANSKKTNAKSGSFQFSVSTQVLTNANLLTVPAKKEKFSIKSSYSGHIDYNENPDRLVIVNTKYEGWVEALYVSKEGVNIAAGQLLMGVYSPSLLAAKEEYLTTYTSLKNLYESQGKSAEEIAGAIKKDETLRAARQKLKYLDVSESEIRKIETELQASRLTLFYAPIGGTITKKDVLQGAYINAGQEVMRIANLNQLWVYIHVFEKDLAFIHSGQKAILKTAAYPDREYAGVVDLIYPYLDPMTKDIKVRINLNNPGNQLKPGMFAEVAIDDRLPGESIVIPDTAVIHSGEKTYVFVSLGAGDFEMRPVLVKVTSDGKSVISRGLGFNELVVMNGQFLLDSEASLKDAVSKEKAGTHIH